MNYETINNNLSLFFLKITLLLFALAAAAPNLNKLFLNDYFCSFLILTIGLSHGALDNYKGKKILLFFNRKNMALFYFPYLLLCALMIISWYYLPTFSLTLLLIIGSYHFGKEDSDLFEIRKSKFKKFLLFLKGSIIIFSPLLFNFNETIIIFQTLSLENNYLIYFLNFLNNNNMILYIVIISFLSTMQISNQFEVKFLMYLEFSSIILLNYLFNPFTAFTVYFCFLHSLRHIVVLNKDFNLLKKRNSNYNFSFYNMITIFYNHAIKLTLVASIIFIISLFISSNILMIDQSILKIIFPGLAALTLPHIILEYIFEKVSTKSLNF